VPLRRRASGLDDPNRRNTRIERMAIVVARAIVLLAEIYLGGGLLFALAFATFGASRIDPAARGATIGFRVLVVPGAALFWPLLLRRWLRREPPPRERNAHRDAAAKSEHAQGNHR
jgi:membrane protein implicated in regulation of membrane protease activity